MNTYRPGLYLCTTAVFIYCGMLFYKYIHFGFNDWDLAYFSQSMWNLSHGSMYVSLAGINFNADHAHLIAFLLIPFYKIFGHPLMLLYSKAIVFGISAFMLYRFAFERLGQRSAWMFTFIYLIFPANVFTILYQFNIENYAPVFLIGMAHYYLKDKKTGFLLCALGACLIKENLPLMVAMFGFHAIFFKKKDKAFWVGVPIVGGLGVFLFLIKILIPFFRGSSDHSFWIRYAHLGHTPWQIVLALLDPRVWWGQINTALNMNYLISLFGSLLPLVLIRLDFLLMIFPILAYHLISAHFPEHSIYYHYGLTMTPFIFMSAILSLAWINKNLAPKTQTVLLYFILVISVIQTLLYIRPIYERLDYHHDHRMGQRWAMVRAIPPGEGVVASFDFLAELSGRKHLYAFYKIHNDIFQDPNELQRSEISTGQVFVVPPEVKYALIDFKDEWYVEDRQRKLNIVHARVKHFLKDFKSVKRMGSIVLFERYK